MSKNVSITLDKPAIQAINELKEHLISYIELVQPDYSKTRKNAIVDYQIPVTQVMGPKEIGDMHAAKRD